MTRDDMTTSSVAHCPTIRGLPPNGHADHEDHHQTCRICHYPGSADDPLRYPCACRGSIRFVHGKCLLRWLHHSQTHSCEICKHTYSFTPIYAEGTPPSLSFQELFLLVSAKAISSLQFFLRFCVVLLIWIFILPFTTFRIWLITLARSLSDTTKVFSGHFLTPVELFTDSLLGIVLTIGLVVVAEIGSHLFEYVIYLVKRGPDSQEIGNQHERPRRYRPVGPSIIDYGRQQMNRHDAADLAAPARVEAVENESFDKFIGLKGPIHHLLKNCIMVLAINVVHLGILSFVPFSMGRMFLYYLPFTRLSSLQYKQSAAELTDPITKFVKPPNLSDLSAIMAGYTFILVPIIFYISFKNAKKVLGGIRRLFMSFQVLHLDSLRDVMVNLKQPLVILVELMVFPLISGWWIDVCSLELLGSSIDSRLRYFWVDPARSMFLHFFLGFVYHILISSFIEDVQEVLNNRVVHFLCTMRHEPVAVHSLLTKTARYHAFRLLLLFSIYGSSIVLVIHMPVRLIMQLHLASSIFPLNFEISAMHAQVFLILVYTPNVIMNVKYPRSAIRVFLKLWFAMAGRVLNLASNLLPADLSNRNGLLARRVSETYLHASSDVGKVDELNQEDHKYDFLFPVMLLLVFAWINIVLFSSAMIVIPAFIGRVAFDAMPHPSVLDAIWECDIFAVSLGFYILRRWLVMARSFISSIRNQDVFSLVSETWEWCITDLKSMLFYSVWISGVPLMIGLLLEALTLPFTVKQNESFLFPELQLCWVVGAFLLRFTTLSISLDILNVDNGSLGAKVARMELYSDRFRENSALTEVIVPMFSHLLTALCLPYVLANLILPLVGFPHPFHYAWIGFLALYVACIFDEEISSWGKKLHDYMKDDQYLIERRLSNYGEE